MRAMILVMDSVGIGAAPDAALYGDEGADTVGHIAEACALGDADNDQRAGPLHLPNLVELGLGEACRLATGRQPPGLQYRGLSCPHYGCASEQSKGKDTPSGHWEIAGVPVPFDWGYFPKTQPCFPEELVARLCEQAELPGIIGNLHASGTEIIAQLGECHIRTGEPICYTSADSVFQIAAHEQTFGLERLYEVCEVCAIARRLVDPLDIGRVIAGLSWEHRRMVSSERRIGAISLSRHRSRLFWISPRRPAAMSSRSARSMTSLPIAEPVAASAVTEITRYSIACWRDGIIWPRAACCSPTSSTSIRSTGTSVT